MWAARAGAEVAFFGQAGDDPVGRQLKADLAAAGVLVDPPAGDLRLDRDAPSGIIIVNVEGGARTMVTDRGANLTVEPDIIAPVALAHSHWLHLTGYSFFEPAPRAAALAGIAGCRLLGLPYSVDPSSYRLIRDYGPQRLLDDISGAAVLFPNLDEAVELAGRAAPPPDLALTLAGGFPVVALKTGAGGCVVAAGQRVEVVPAVEARAAVDPTGAGDAFAAGFLRSLVGTGRGGQWPFTDLVRAAAAGVELAAQAVTMVGGRGRPG